ncbi:MAG TPA: NADP-dependent phosphogluconate dehydrogenase [Acidimicrobiales bacterium]
MELGMVGLGRMGANLVRRVSRAGHHCVVFDVNPTAVKALETEGATGASSLEDLVSSMSAPRAVWVMVPAGEITAKTVSELAEHLEPGDVIIDGGNSYYRDDIARAQALRAKGVHHVDVGTSGGVWGLERGYCLMIGGEHEVVERLQPIFEAIAPGMAAAERTPGRSGEPSPAEHGYLHCGPGGAGHFVKMVHNGIEYAAMAAYAEGLNILKNANAGAAKRDADAETAPMETPSSIATTSTLPRSPRCGGAAASSPRGCWTLPPRPSSRHPISPVSPAGCPTRERAAGRQSQPSKKEYRRR